jgi:hypothetical protein
MDNRLLSCCRPRWMAAGSQRSHSGISWQLITSVGLSVKLLVAFTSTVSPGFSPIKIHDQDWVWVLCYDRRSRNKAPIWGLRPDFYYLCDSYGLVLVGRPLWWEMTKTFVLSKIYTCLEIYVGPSLRRGNSQSFCVGASFRVRVRVRVTLRLAVYRQSSHLCAKLLEAYKQRIFCN